MGIFSGRGFGILVDIGGSGVRIAPYSGGKIGNIRNCRIESRDALFEEIRRTAGTNTVTGLAFSVAGFVDSEKGAVLMSRNAGFLEGSLADEVKRCFPAARVRVVNDGEAHARSLLLLDNIKFGAIHLALGTSVAFGAINEKGEVIPSLSGVNWDIGDMKLLTRADKKEVWYALGSAGLRELEETLEGDPYVHFGYRLGTLLTQLSVILRPRTIGLSGGIVTAHADAIRKGIKHEFREPALSGGTDIRLLTGADTVMQGLTTLL